ncbi:hypothetical protein TNCV_4847251 [Trichonephila clavipes]|nr:hypothetical protein TNCV_4847251 [Trichonephila clavipes]
MMKGEWCSSMRPKTMRHQRLKCLMPAMHLAEHIGMAFTTCGPTRRIHNRSTSPIRPRNTLPPMQGFRGQTRYQFLLEAGPLHKWYESNHPGAALFGTGSRLDETTLAGFLSGPTRV